MSAWLVDLCAHTGQPFLIMTASMMSLNVISNIMFLITNSTVVVAQYCICNFMFAELHYHNKYYDTITGVTDCIIIVTAILSGNNLHAI